MGQSISGHLGTSQNSYRIGDGKDGYKYVNVNNNLGFTPGLRYNDTDGVWELSNDGVSWVVIGSSSCCPGYIGDDGYVLTAVGGATDWTPNNQTESSSYSVGDNTESIVSIEFKTDTEDVAINYDSSNETLYLSSVDGNQNVVLTEANDPSTILYGDYIDSNINMHMKTSEGDGYIVYNATLGVIEKKDDGDIFNSYLVETEAGDINTVVIGDHSEDITSIHMTSSSVDGYISYDGDLQAMSLTVNGNVKYSLFTDGYDTTSGNILYANGSEYTDLTIGSQGQVMSTSGSIPVWSSDISLPDGSPRTITQTTNTNNIDGYTLTIKAQDTAANYKGADLYLEGGDSNAAGDGYGGSVALVPGINTAGRSGNIYMHNAPIDTQCNNMENGICVGEAVTTPDGYDNLGGVGGYLYSTSGALVWKSGESGTETTMGPGSPHCPRCNRDFATSWRNNGESLSICMWCLSESLISAGIDADSFIIKKGR